MLWKKKSAAPAGRTVLALGEDLVHGVSVGVPGKDSALPRVLKHVVRPAAQLDQAMLAELAAALAVPRFEWGLLARRNDYRLTVLPKPEVEAADLADSLRWSVEGVLDYPVDEALIDYMLIPVSAAPERAQDVYVVSAPRGTMSAFGDSFVAAGLALRTIDIREAAQRNYASVVAQPGEDLVIVAPDEQGVQITLTRDGELLLDRFIAGTMIAPDGEGAPASPRAFERVAVELQRSIFMAKETLPLLELRRVLVAPGYPALLAHLQAAIEIPVEALPLEKVFDLSAVPELALPVNQAAYFAVLGAALRGLKPVPQVNLWVKPPPGPRFSAAVAALGLGVTVVAMLGWWQWEHSRSADLEAQLAQDGQRLEALRAELRSRQAELQSLRVAGAAGVGGRRLDEALMARLRSGEFGSLQGYAGHLDTLATIPGKGVSLSAIAITRAGKEMRLQGQAIDEAAVLDYAATLNERFASRGVSFAAIELSAGQAGGEKDGQKDGQKDGETDGERRAPPLSFRLY